MRALGLTERQIDAVKYVHEHGSIDNATYRDQFGVSKRTASRDLGALEEHALLTRSGRVGKGTVYTAAV